MKIKTIEQLDIENKLLFLRTDYDFTPDTDAAEIDFKIDSTLYTIQYAIENGAKLIIASHRTVKEHKYDPQYSLGFVGDILSARLNTNIYFPEDCIGDAVKKIKQDMNPGDVMLLENLMFHKDEIKNEPAFSRKLSENVDVYVSEAFGLANKTYSSNTAMLEYINEKCAGFCFTDELMLLTDIKASQQKPFVVFYSGGDVYTKLEFLEHMKDNIDVLMLGGVFANTLLKSIGYEISEGCYDKESVYRINKLYKSLTARNKKVVLPEDFMIGIKHEKPEGFYIDELSKLKENFQITGVGKKTQQSFIKNINEASVILWDGGSCFTDMYKEDVYKKDIEDNINKADKDCKTDPITAELINNNEKLKIICDYKSCKYFNTINEKLQISYNIDCAYSYLKGENLPGLQALEHN
ncbi:MAG: phosphoglycerate kinase, partial [Candidatus Dadabacteria bacterium]|nr:phosphoglycerate kinase [Candidatus Dadabacteria bacterium]NIV41064.1 phosphoglycerate kinase [Candidatus Dadabacteria bacterium]NIX14423.1 phosphoglycerate kinase [Candidatus Dadabacteria bacterium]